MIDYKGKSHVHSYHLLASLRRGYFISTATIIIFMPTEREKENYHLGYHYLTKNANASRLF